ncbi:MAG: GNAT family N-acetyltransferase [Chlamydiota bacterium]|nr:GNAT family N-acetyltransferase [Chlamydiota bacterium]
MDNDTLVLIRQSTPDDRIALREICCDTADKGSPVEGFFPDRDIFSDLLMNYYMTYEPQSLWVVEISHKIVGYLSGCQNHRRFLRMVIFRIMPAVIIKSLRKKLILNKKIWVFIRYNAALWLKNVLSHHFPVRDFPAHLHINLQQGYRGKHIGSLLLEKFLVQLKEGGVKGVHASVRDDNQGAKNFFQSLGFIPLERYCSMIKPYHDRKEHIYTVIFGKKCL